MARILIIDDDEMLCDVLSRQLNRFGHAVKCTFTLKEGLRMTGGEEFDVVFLDVNLPDGNGIEAVPKIKVKPSSPEIIIFTAQGDPDGAELAIQSGAWDYVQKPPSLKGMLLPLLRALQYREEKIRKAPGAALKLDGIVGRSPKMARCIDLLAESVRTDANVLITGETGTGKELFAKAIHEKSPRSQASFVVVDCGALPETLVESTLFGHEKGAFTGADKAQEGLVSMADRGTLFLDEVGELPLSIQMAFLRVLQEHSFRPVGGKRELKSDFRLIAATNRNLDEAVDTGEFRKDLLYRLRSIEIDLPPLRRRTGDIRDLAMFYVKRFCDKYNLETKGFSPEFLEAICNYTWPGNVRELMHALERSLSAASQDPVLFPVHLPTHIRVQLAQAAFQGESPALPGGSEPAPTEIGTLRGIVESAERKYLEDLLATTGGNIKEACRVSGLSRTRLYERLKKYKIQSRT